jgi:hypothetical protein
VARREEHDTENGPGRHRSEVPTPKAAEVFLFNGDRLTSKFSTEGLRRIEVVVQEDGSVYVAGFGAKS